MDLYTEIKLYYRTTLPCGATRRRSSSQLSDTLVVTACVVGAHTTCGTAATAYVPQFDRESPYPRSTPVSVDGRGFGLADARGEGLAGSFLLRQRELDALLRRLGTLGSRERAHSTPRISPERDIRPSKM